MINLCLNVVEFHRRVYEYLCILLLNGWYLSLQWIGSYYLAKEYCCYNHSLFLVVERDVCLIEWVNQYFHKFNIRYGCCHGKMLSITGTHTHKTLFCVVYHVAYIILCFSFSYSTKFLSSYSYLRLKDEDKPFDQSFLFFFIYKSSLFAWSFGAFLLVCVSLNRKQ